MYHRYYFFVPLRWSDVIKLHFCQNELPLLLLVRMFLGWRCHGTNTSWASNWNNDGKKNWFTRILKNHSLKRVCPGFVHNFQHRCIWLLQQYYKHILYNLTYGREFLEEVGGLFWLIIHHQNIWKESYIV